MARDTLKVAAAFALALLVASPASGEDTWTRTWGSEIVVSNAAEFQRALAEVPAGGAISLQPGTYDRLSVREFQRDGFVVVRSADPDDRAQVRALDVAGSARVWFQGLLFAGPRRSPRTPGYLALVKDSRDVGIVDSEFHGIEDGDFFNDPSGAHFRATDGVVFAGNELHHLVRGAVFGGVRHARVSDNRFVDLRSDGADFAGVQDVAIDGNVFSTFHPAPKDHADFIQFWQRNALIEDTRDIVIRGNVFLQGTGAATQTILVGNHIEGRLYRNFTVEDNVIYNAHPHGISLYDLRGGRVANNTLVAFPNGNPDFPGGNYAPRINLFRTQGVTVRANVAPDIALVDTRDIVFQSNLITGDARPVSRRHPEHLFVDYAAQGAARAASFAPRPGGLLDRPPGERLGALPVPAEAKRN